jgi:hypothetical protein
MKKIICILVSVAFMFSLYAQEKYTVQVRTDLEKYITVKSQFYSFMNAGISFAKSKGVSPFEYGKYVGNLFAPSWNQEIGFEGFVRSVIRTWESMKTDTEGTITVTEKPDGSVIMEFPKVSMMKYFAAGIPIATFEECIEYFRGVIKPIADKFSCSLTLIANENFLVFTFKKN